MNKLTEKQKAWVNYAMHNFGDRGSSSVESAAVGGMGQLACGLMGSDNFNTMRYIERYYGLKENNYVNAEDYIDAKKEFRARMMHSINATEHSSTTAWLQSGEIDMIMNHLDMNKGKAIIAAVLDSYDYLKMVKAVCAQDGKFQRKINSDDYPVFVMRPDSGNPKDMIGATLNIMEEENVPYTMNKRGFKVFNKMRIIWGDGITDKSIDEMLQLLYRRKYSSENIAFGSGGWLMQQHNRDTQGWAVKCSEITLDEGSPIETGEIIDGQDKMVWESFYVTRDVFKDPVTAPNKKSKKGRMTLYNNIKTGEFITGSLDNPILNDDDWFDIMSVVYENGKMMKTYTFDEVRKANAWVLV